MIQDSGWVDLLPQHSQRRSSKDEGGLLRLTARHFPSKIPRTKKKKTPTRRCVVCKEKGKPRKETTYFCRECDAPLCAAPCFGEYHTKRHYEVMNEPEETDVESD